MSDHSVEVGNVNDETISNQSGDMLLLCDDEEINTYADILRRQRRVPVNSTLGLQAESYLGCGRFVTDFERTHFG